jgi:hypothetical protein
LFVKAVVEADRDEKPRVVVEQDSPGAVNANVRIRLPCISLSAHEGRRDLIDSRLSEPRLAGVVSLADTLSPLVQTVKKWQNCGSIVS